MILVIKAVIPAFEYTQWTKTNLYSQLTYNQDGCTMQETKYGALNIFTGKPYTGYNSLRQEYYNAPDLTMTRIFDSVPACQCRLRNPTTPITQRLTTITR